VPRDGTPQPPRSAGRRLLQRAELSQNRAAEHAVPEARVGAASKRDEQGTAGAVIVENRLLLDRRQPLEIVQHEHVRIAELREQPRCVDRIERDSRGRRAGLRERCATPMAHPLRAAAPAVRPHGRREYTPVVERQRVGRDLGDTALFGQARNRQERGALAALGQREIPTPELGVAWQTAHLDAEIAALGAERVAREDTAAPTSVGVSAASVNATFARRGAVIGTR
jgi:hypothetical protein